MENEIVSHPRVVLKRLEGELGRGKGEIRAGNIISKNIEFTLDIFGFARECGSFEKLAI